MSEIINVKAKNKSSYNIIIEENDNAFFENLNKIYPSNAHKICIVTDSNVSKLYSNQIKDILQEKFNDVLIYSFDAGEENKTLLSINGLYDVLISNNFHRNDILIALGGGVVGDMTGFAAATFLRGIDFIQFPTTLLSQIDSSIGGKTGVDYNGFKNMIGAFHMPKMVYISTNKLSTLPNSQFSSGMAEIIKHGIIRDKEYLEWLVSHSDDIKALNPAAIEYMIKLSCIIKRDVVEEDPEEKGLRAILNFGHTIGHAVEKCSDFKLLHGQCVSIGIMAAIEISHKRGYISKEEVEYIRKALVLFDLPVKCNGIKKEMILAAIKQDKKMVHNKIKFILIKRLGDAYIDTSISDEELAYAVDRVVN